jgi:hypothetical protein
MTADGRKRQRRYLQDHWRKTPKTPKAVLVSISRHAHLSELWWIVNQDHCRPVCGTGGFFLSAYDYISKNDLDKHEKRFLKYNTFFGNKIVASARRLD